jgi:uncharacterized membrane protein YphA (DoxX/SURF4 family)
MRAIIWVSRAIVGLLFIFSGFIKANDPLGFSYKLEEYFEKFAAIFNASGLGLLAYPMEWLAHIALPMAILIVVTEMILGVLTLTGTYMKKVSLYLLVMIVFFTFLTFVSWYFEIVKTCGCFGEVIPLTPFQSFLKDLVLLVLILVLFVFRKSFVSFFSSTGDKIAFWGSAVVAFMFSWFCYQHLPIMDFGNYGPEKSLKEEMQAKKGNPITLYKLRHKTSGIEVEFADYPQDYNNWEYLGDPRFVDGELEIIKIEVKSTGQVTRVLEIPDFFKSKWTVLEKSTETFIPDLDPKIQQLSAFYFRNKEQDFIDTMLNHDDFYFWLILRDFTQFGDFVQTDAGLIFQQNSYGKSTFGKMNALAKQARRKKIKFHVLCSEGLPDKIEAFRHGVDAEFLFYICDDTELKTMVRSSPGLLLLKKDRVINKWHYNDFMTFEEINNEYINK